MKLITAVAVVAQATDALGVRGCTLLSRADWEMYSHKWFEYATLQLQNVKREYGSIESD
jgi:hypothetical protein